MQKSQLDETINFQFKYPPDLELCKKHKLATRIFRGITSQNMKTDVCECCGRKVGLQIVQTKCIYNSSAFAFLGPGIPLYFKFLKYSVFLMIVFTLIFSIYGLYSNIIEKSCSNNPKCTSTIWNQMSIINKKTSQTYMFIQNYCLLAFVCVCILILQVLRYRFRKVQQIIDQIDVSAGDYSIILKRLPPNINQDIIRKEIQQKIDEFHQHQKLKPEAQRNVIKIQKIILSYDLSQYYKQKQNLLDKFKQFVQDQQQKSPSKIKQKFDFQSNVIQKPKNNGLLAIVVFQKQYSKSLFIRQPSHLQKTISYFFTPFSPLSQFQIQKTKISIERAPQPDDIIWQNAHITPCQRMQRKILLNCISFILLFCGGICQYGLAVWQTSITDSTTKTLVGTAASIVVTLTNFILKQFLTISTKMQRIYTQTQYLDILTFKLISQQFLNSGVFVVGANILANWNGFDLEDSLPDTITQIMILNAITTNASTFIMKYFDIMGYIKRYLFIEKKFLFYTQLKANILCQLPKPDFPQKYSFIIKTLWLTAFYAPLVPIVIPISALGLLISYFLQKFLFATSYSVSNKFGSTLNNSCIQGLQYIPVILSVGQLLIYLYFQRFYYTSTPSGWYIIIYVCLALSFANLILPMKQFNQGIQECFKNQAKVISANFIKIESNILPYQQAKKRFEVTYEMSNPVYAQKRTKKRDTLVEKQMNNFFKNIISKDHEAKNNDQQIDFNNILGFNHLSQESVSQNNFTPLIKNDQQVLDFHKTQDIQHNSQNKSKHENSLSSFITNTKQNIKILISKKQDKNSSSNKIHQTQHQNINSSQTPSLFFGLMSKNNNNNQQDSYKNSNQLQENTHEKAEPLTQPQPIETQPQLIARNQQQIKKLFNHHQQKLKSNNLIKISQQGEFIENKQ